MPNNAGHFTVTTVKALCSGHSSYLEADSLKKRLWLSPATIYLLTEEDNLFYLLRSSARTDLKWELGVKFVLSRIPADKIRDDNRTASSVKNTVIKVSLKMSTAAVRRWRESHSYSKADSTECFHLSHFSSSPWKPELGSLRCSLERKQVFLKQKWQTMQFKRDFFSFSFFLLRAQGMNSDVCWDSDN